VQLLTGTTTTSATLSQESCYTYCSTGGDGTGTMTPYAFFGIEDSNICHCGNGYG
jgi:hypothetical protein